MRDVRTADVRIVSGSRLEVDESPFTGESLPVAKDISAVAADAALADRSCMLFFSLALLYFVRSDWRISRRQGVFAVTGYVVFLVGAFFRGWG